MLRIDDEDENERLGRQAGDIFFKHLVSELIEETAEWKEVIDRFKHLRDFVNRVELRFDGVDCDDSKLGIKDEQKVYSSVGKFENTIEVNDIFTTAFSDIEHIPLSCMTSGKLLVANQTVVLFHVTRMHVVGVLSNGNEVGVVLTDNDIMLCGSVQKLNEDDLRRFRDGTYGEDEMQENILTGVGLLKSPGAVFVPQVIAYPRASMFEEIMDTHLELLSMLDDDSKPYICENNNFRRLVIKALGTHHELSKLRVNDQIKKTMSDIRNVYSWIDLVYVEHGGDEHISMLSDGLPGFKDGIEEWILPVFETVNNLSSFGLRISGLKQHESRNKRLTIRLKEADDTKAQVQIHFYTSTIVHGEVDLEGFDLNDDSWEQNVRSALLSGGVDLRLHLISIKLVDIEDTLIALGVDYKNIEW